MSSCTNRARPVQHGLQGVHEDAEHQGRMRVPVLGCGDLEGRLDLSLVFIFPVP